MLGGVVVSWVALPCLLGVVALGDVVALSFSCFTPSKHKEGNRDHHQFEFHFVDII